MSKAAERRRLSELTVQELRKKAQRGEIVRFSRRDGSNGDRRKENQTVEHCNRDRATDRRQQQTEKTGMCLEFRPGVECMTITMPGEPAWPIPIRHLREFG